MSSTVLVWTLILMIAAVIIVGILVAVALQRVEELEHRIEELETEDKNGRK